MISNDANFGYEKILGLMADRDKDREKQSLEARDDAFLNLKIRRFIDSEFMKICHNSQASYSTNL